MTWQIWLAIASIVFIVFGLVKRLETRMLLIVAGFILCCASGAPMKAFGAFVKGMTNITLVPAICSAMGFAFAVQASKCDQHLVAAVAAPLKKLGGLLIPAATILTFLINIAIMSAAGTAATAARLLFRFYCVPASDRRQRQRPWGAAQWLVCCLIPDVRMTSTSPRWPRWILWPSLSGLLPTSSVSFCFR